MTLTRGAERCFSARCPTWKHPKAYGYYEPMDDDISHSNIIASLKNEDGKTEWSSKDVDDHEKGHFWVDLKPGNYVFCLSSKVTTRISFHFEITSDDYDDEGPDDHTRQILDHTSQLKMTFGLMLDSHDLSRSMINLHRDLIERTFSSVVFWVILRSVLLVLTCVCQVFYVVRVFEKPKRMC